MMFRKSLTRLFILTLIIAIILIPLNYFIPLLASFQQFTWLSLIFFFIITLITVYIGLRGLEKSGHGFVASVNGIVMIKLFFCAGLVIVYMLIARPGNATFILPFFLFYVLFTVFEIREVLKAQKMLLGQKAGKNN